MSQPYLGEIKMFGGNFAPRGYALCQGQLLSIAQNSALFAILGTTYGGDGVQTFGLPDLRGRVPVHPGQGPGLPPLTLGEKGGVESVTLSVAQLPAHGHGLMASADLVSTTAPGGNVMGAKGRGGANLFAPASSLTPLAVGTGGNAGGGQAHTNMQPSLVLNFIIALEGVFPSRN
jgi:microcystin-dependent protein